LPNKIRILFIDDDDISQELNKAVVAFHYDDLCKKFSLIAIDLFFAGNLIDTKKLLNSAAGENRFPHVIISDIQLIGVTGFDFLDIYEEDFLKEYPKTVVALITADADENARVKIKKYKFTSGVFVRPIDDKILKILIEEAITKYS